MRVPSFAVPTPGVFDITKFGAVGDAVINSNGTIASGTDNSAALAAAIAAVTAAGGGTVLIPQGNFRLQSAMNAISLQLFGMEIVFRGVGSGSRLIFDAAGLEPFNIDATFATVKFEDLTLVGNGTDNCGFYAIVISFAQTLRYESCLFFGIKTGSPTGVYHNNCAQVALVDCNFLGCGSQYNTDGLIGFYLCGGIAFVRTHCLDIASLGGSTGPTYTSELSLTTGAWIFIQNPQQYPPVGVQNDGRIYFEDVQLDENPIRAINIAPTSTNRWLHVELNGVRNNCSSQGSIVRAIGIAQCNTVRIRNTWVGYNTTQAAIGLELIDAGDVLIDGYETNSLTNTVKIDSLTAVVKFRNSFGQYVIQFATTPIPCFDETNGIVSRWRLSQNALDANTIGKPGATAGYVDQLGTGDNGRLALGVILDSVGAGAPTRVVEENGQQVEMLSDGAGVLAPAETLVPSTLNAGRVAKTVSSGAQSVGLTMGSAVATANTPVQAIWQRGTY